MDTIVAIATAPGNAGIGIVRMSGEDSFSILKKLFQPKYKKPEQGYTIQYGKIINDQGEIIDEVLVSYFKAPRSYTGENVCEINSHGNQVILNIILQECIHQGAVLAEPGEFTKRAFLNGRIDLLQAEAVMDLIHAKSELERKEAMKELDGVLSKKIRKIKQKILSILTEFEVSIDYPEYNLEANTKEAHLDTIQNIRNQFLALEKTFENGKLLKDGVKVALIGKPNAGKSSLLNKILKEDRAIVTDIEGTTRDTIEEWVTIKGIPFQIVDTAGIREASNEIEKIGIEKSKKALEEANLIIAIFDATKEITGEDIQILQAVKEKKAILLLNKVDLENVKVSKQDFMKYGKTVLETSMKTGEGIERLFEEMEKMFMVEEIETENVAIITNIRHKQAIQKARESIEEAQQALACDVPIDIVSIYLKQAIEFLNEITGENVTEDILQDIFSKFCLGK